MAADTVSTGPARRLLDTRSDHRSPRPEGSAESRRWFLRGLVGASGLALAASPPTLGQAAQFGLTHPTTDDVLSLRLLLDLEHLAYALYREAAHRHDEDAGNDVATSLNRLVLHRLSEHECNHVGLLTALIVERDGPVASVPAYDFAYADEREFVQVAAEIENALVGTYVEILPAINEPFLCRVLTSLLAVEARHAAYVSGLSGELSFPQAREGAASRTASLLVIDRYRVN